MHKLKWVLYKWMWWYLETTTSYSSL